MRPRRRLAVALAVATLAGSAAAEPAERPIGIAAAPVEIATDGLQGVSLRHAWELRADDAAFGGLSALEVSAGRLVALGDRGVRLEARFRPDGPAPVLAEARLAAIAGPDGTALEGRAADAESLAPACKGLAAAFEHDHRLALPDGETVGRAALAELPANGGIEALAPLPGPCGRLIAVGEDADAAGHPVFVVEAGAVRPAPALPALDGHGVTAADLGPEGDLYVLFRRYDPLSGLDVRLLRYALGGAPPLPDPATARTLARFGPESGVDNMEGLAAWRDGAGRTRIALVSDDNFNPLQRTLLIDLVVE